MELHNTTHWSDLLQPVLAAYNNTKHSATGVAPNDVNRKNETQIAMKMRSKAKTGSYPDVNEGYTRHLRVSSKNGALTYIQFRKIIMMEYIKLMVICILEKKYNL
jgi:hypothetical protein